MVAARQIRVVKCWSVLLGLSAAVPATAGTAVSMTFGGGAASQVVATNGVTATRSGQFVLYQHGFSPARAEQPSKQPDLSSTATVSPAPTSLDVDCYSQAAPARGGLPSQTVLKRLTWWPLVRDAECRYRLPGGLLDALVLQESRYSVAALSPARAGGLTQLMPGTALGLGVANRFEPLANVDGGARYLRSMLDRYRSVPFALAAYNAGPGAVDRSGGIPRNRETPGYVTHVLDYWTRGIGASDSAAVQAVAAHATVVDFSGSSRE